MLMLLNKVTIVHSFNNNNFEKPVDSNDSLPVHRNTPHKSTPPTRSHNPTLILIGYYKAFLLMLSNICLRK